jgi:hypothetical protein
LAADGVGEKLLEVAKDRGGVMVVGEEEVLG